MDVLTPRMLADVRAALRGVKTALDAALPEAPRKPGRKTVVLNSLWCPSPADAWDALAASAAQARHGAGVLL